VSIRRVAVIFDNEARPETTGVYCRRALGRLVEVEHFLPSDLSRLSPGEFDLYLNIDDGLPYRIPAALRPSAWWAIDTHLDLGRCLEKARDFDAVYAAQRDGAEALRSAGVPSATWLSLACDPEIHRKHDVEKTRDVAFVGNVFPGEREELLRLIRGHFPNSYAGRLYFEEMALAYSSARLAFNRSVRNDVNMRVFEALACGSLLLTNDLGENGQGELFQDGRHLATYSDPGELLEKIGYYLARPDLRERIAAEGRKAAHAHHTYEHRMRVILGRAEAAASPSRTAAAPGRPGKELPYFGFARPEVAALVPATARRVLDVGCGAGRLGELLKRRGGVEVVGIELDGRAIAEAGRRLDRVIAGDLESDDFDLPESGFDCIICADVLEHLRSPDRALEKLRRWLKPGGDLVASIPNVRNHTVVGPLLEGNWTYEPSGLLDGDHVRFFTRREIGKLFFRAGFEIEQWRIVPGPGHREWVEAGRPGMARIGPVELGGITPEEAEEFYVYQYLTRARPRPARPAARPPRGDDPPSRGERAPGLGPGPEGRLAELRRAFPWPARRPAVGMRDDPLDGPADGARQLLARRLAAGTRLVVEVGGRLGGSTRFIAEHAPSATVISLSRWEGDPEHTPPGGSRPRDPSPYEAFLAACWPLRDRIVPLIATAQEGLGLVNRCGLRPDLVYVSSAGSGLGAVLEHCRRYFPGVVVVGDGYDEPGVADAARDHASGLGLELEVAGAGERAWALDLAGPGDAGGGNPAGALLTSIIVLTHNELSFTIQCLDSIRARTDEPYQLIVVDNASTDGTREYLRSLEGVIVVENAENRGFPAGVNQGIRVAKGRQVLLLNNDCIVTTGWLRRLLDALHGDPVVGLVGPSSNNVSGGQQVPANYRDAGSIDGFAWDWGADHGHECMDVDRLVGFCLLIDRAVIDRIGLLDERFGIGCFEDDDYCRRAIKAGFRLIHARGAFVHHYGSRTFRGVGLDYPALLAENRRKYEAKLRGEEPGGPPGPPAAPLAPEDRPPVRPTYQIAGGGAGGLRLRRAAVRLSACLIVRDNERTLGPCLESLLPWVDEVIVVDTGSTDGTPELAARLGARLFHFPWCDDFSAARNESLSHARGDWVFWMDSDDTITEACGRGLRDLALGDHRPEVLGYVMQVHCPGGTTDGADDVTCVDHVKLIRNRPDLHFEGRIHEQVLPSIRRAGGEVAWTGLHVVHSGSDQTAEGRARKLERDFRLLGLELRDQPDHPFVLFNLGMTHADGGQHAEAIEFLRRGIRVADPKDSHLRKAYALLAASLQQIGRSREAQEECEAGLRLFPSDKELLFRRALLHQHFGRLRDAERSYLRVLEEREDRHFTSVDSGIAGFKARHNLAVVYGEQGRHAEAADQWRHALGERPLYRVAWRGLFGALLQHAGESEAEELAATMLGDPGLRIEGLILTGRLREFRGDYEGARRDLEAALSEAPDDLDALREVCRFIFERVGPESAGAHLARLAALDPSDASVHHNLGVVLRSTGQAEAAARSFRTSLDLRPDWPATVHQLAQLAREVEAHTSNEVRRTTSGRLG